MWIYKNLIYFPILKNMSTFMTDWMLIHGATDTIELPKSGTKFAIIRNPIDRFISTYVQIVPQRLNYGKFTIETLKLFIQDLEKSFFDTHLRPQTVFLPCEMDIYILQEEVEKGIVIGEKITIPKHTIKANEGNSVLKKLVRKQLTTALINKLKRIYKGDFELYGRCRNKKGT